MKIRKQFKPELVTRKRLDKDDPFALDHLYCDNEHLVATNRIILVSIPVDRAPNDPEKGFIAPQTLQIARDSSESDSVQIAPESAEYNYPDWQKVLPQNFKGACNCILDLKLLTKAAKALGTDCIHLTLLPDSHSPVILTIADEPPRQSTLLNQPFALVMPMSWR